MQQVCLTPAQRPTKPRTPAHFDPSPDTKLFARVGGQWRVQLAALTGAPASPAQLRAILSAGAALGADTNLETIPDDLLVTAAMSGATTSMAMLDILDGSCFTRAPCLCCYVAHSAKRAREAATAMQEFCRYFDTDSYVRSRAYARTVAAMLRDLRPEEVAEVKDHVASLNTTPDTIREINGSRLGEAGHASLGLCVVLPSCQPGVLWVYSTPEGRRLLRHLARKKGSPVKVTVASSDPSMAPRFRFRMYAASLVAPALHETALLDTALAWVRARSRR